MSQIEILQFLDVGNYGRLAYESFRLPSVRLRLESIRLRTATICKYRVKMLVK